MESIPALESIPLWNRFRAILIPVLLLRIPTPVLIPEKNGIITPLGHSLPLSTDDVIYGLHPYILPLIFRPG